MKHLSTQYFDGNQLKEVGTPTENTDAANKAYVDAAIPSAPGTLNTNNSSAQSVNSSEALTGAVNLHKVSKTGNYNDLLNKPSLAAVATSGSYNDLTDKPTIPAAQVQANWNETNTSSKAYIQNKPTTIGLAEVEFTVTSNVWSCDMPIADIINNLENNIRVIAKISDNTTEIFEAVSYYSDNAEMSVYFVFVKSADSYSIKGSSLYDSGTGDWGTDTWSYSYTAIVDTGTLANGLASKQNELISGYNIKTINNQSLLGSGNITIQGGGGGDVNVIEVVKVNGSALTVDSNKAVDITDIPWSIVSSKPTIPDVTGKADKVSGATSDNIAALDANGNLKDAEVSSINVKDAVSKRHSHSNKTYLDKIPSAVGSNGQVLTSDGTAWSWQTPSSGGLTNYDYTHTVSSGVSGTVAVTFPANQRCSVMYGATSDIELVITCNNGADNYVWVKNNGSAAIDITIKSVTYNNTLLAASNIFLPDDGISVDKGYVCEIGVLCNADGAFITARGDLKASS